MKRTAIIFSIHLRTADMGWYPNSGGVRGLTTNYLKVILIINQLNEQILVL